MSASTLSPEEVEIVFGMLSFCEENWSAFVFRMQERGMEEHKVDALFKELWEKTNG